MREGFLDVLIYLFSYLSFFNISSKGRDGVGKLVYINYG